MQETDPRRPCVRTRASVRLAADRDGAHRAAFGTRRAGPSSDTRISPSRVRGYKGDLGTRDVPRHFGHSRGGKRLLERAGLGQQPKVDPSVVQLDSFASNSLFAGTFDVGREGFEPSTLG